MNHHPLEQAAIEAAKIGGEVLTKYRTEGVVIRNKADQGGKSYDLVSDADIESEQRIAEFLRSKFPDHQLLGEENLRADTQADHLWVIDPLDGTNNFAHGLPHFAVSIAYYERGVAKAAAVYNPARDEMYHASAGGGAFLNEQSITVGSSTSLDQALIGCGFYYDRGEMMRKTLAAVEQFFEQDIHGIRRFGTASLDLCQVASGQFGGFFEYQLSPWDFAAGALIVTEAGGIVTTAKGDALPLQKTSLVAASPMLHPLMLEITTTHHP